MRNKVNSLALFLLCFSFDALGQELYHYDPYKIENAFFSDLLSSNSRGIIIANKVEEVRRYRRIVDLKRLKSPVLDTISLLRFNTMGLPVYFNSLEVYETIYKKHPRLVRREAFFNYDETGRLVQIKEIDSEVANHHSEIFVYFLYDSLNRLYKETNLYLIIYRPGFSYRGVIYHDDTTVCIYKISYDNGNRVKQVILKKKESYADTSTYWDTVYIHKDFDEIFHSRQSSNDLYDKDGKIKERINFRFHYHEYFTNDTEYIVRPIYNDHNSIVQWNTFSPKGKFLYSNVYIYKENGLLEIGDAMNNEQREYYDYKYFTKE